MPVWISLPFLLPPRPLGPAWRRSSPFREKQAQQRTALVAVAASSWRTSLLLVAASASSQASTPA
eukprot:CAMPEP_0184522354 /NCGR_PEP_ID=MMETSP0198_2-20121128/8235_1 /TAXON_ID=1112570 /ORGANISM="Thraustochytrium sp., Strain LLF1b" /LENGTH=64 /DNA_ID=CAMNT_0026913171 /DNA_START=1409 /DNA_END=1600 /DNA_ORIENTATION=+